MSREDTTCGVGEVKGERRGSLWCVADGRGRGGIGSKREVGGGGGGSYTLQKRSQLSDL